MSSQNPENNAASGLLSAMRRFASSVTVISVKGPDGQRNAITATSPTSVSMEPPSMLFCVHRESSLASALSEGSGFCINVLADDQEDIARTCASKLKGEERFDVGDWRESETGTPWLANAEAAIVCSVAQVVPFGSHDIVIGTVDAVHIGDPRDPLVYFDGRYRTVTESEKA